MATSKDVELVFGNTGLDPNPTKRKRLKKRAKKAARKKVRRGSSSSSQSGETSSGSSDSPGEVGQLFGQEARVKTVWKKFPGCLTMNTAEFIQNAVVTQSGQPWNLELTAIPPIFSQYWRMMLQPKMTGAMARETQTLSYAQDLLLQGRVSGACDVITQRLKGLEQMANGGHFTVAQKQELVPTDSLQMTSPIESMEASRLQREEMKAKAAASRPWEKRNDWERSEEPKGKGKTKEAKGKGKAKGDHGGAPGGGRDEKERAKK